jgi:heme exporter protein D
MVFFAERHSGFVWFAGALMLVGLGLILARPILARRAKGLSAGDG